MTAISATGLTKRYGDLTAVDGLDLTVEVGEFVGVLGPNGAGKTTLLEMLEGLRKPDGGEVTVLGRRCGRATAASSRGSACSSRPRRSSNG